MHVEQTGGVTDAITVLRWEQFHMTQNASNGGNAKCPAHGLKRRETTHTPDQTVIWIGIDHHIQWVGG